MGIPRFGIYIENNIEGSVIKEPETIEKIKNNVDDLYIDGNGILHNARARTFREQFKNSRKKEEVNIYLERQEYVKTLSELQIWDLLLYETELMIKETFTFFNPKRRFMFAIDGVAPLAKALQQLGRRIKSAMSNSVSVFDRSAITPGTNYMNYLNAFLKNLFKQDFFKSCKEVIYSSHRVVGEGEHKILQLMRSDQSKNKRNIIVYGLDADLILLLLSTHQNKIYLSRESFDEFVSIDIIKTYLNKEIDPLNFIIIMFFVGNDFMQQFSMCRDMRPSIDRMVNVIVKDKLKLYRNGRINWNHMRKFIKQMAYYEPRVLQREANYIFETKDIPNRKVKRDEFLEGALTRDVNTFFITYKNMYYNSEAIPKNPSLDFLFDTMDADTQLIEKISQMCQETIDGLEWYFMYYTQGTKAVNHDWYYPCYHAPLFSELSSYVDNYINTFRFNYQAYQGMVTFNTAQQLVSVIPKASMNILPQELHKLYDIDSPLVDTYPSIIQLDMNGKLFEHEAIPYIPFIDKSSIINAVDNLNLTNPDLTESEENIIIIN